MLIVAYGDAHISKTETQKYLFYGKELDYSPIDIMIMDINQIHPDMVINLGDLQEDYFESESLPIARKLLEINTLNIKGNHDKHGIGKVEFDGIIYEHGIGAGLSATVDETRKYYDGKKIIHGHTHIPKEGWAFDVGSIVISRSYAVIENGIPKLVKV